jgi:tryptophan-rich sensory protein
MIGYVFSLLQKQKKCILVCCCYYCLVVVVVQAVPIAGTIFIPYLILNSFSLMLCFFINSKSIEQYVTLNVY